MYERIRRPAALAAVLGGLILAVAAVVDWLTGVGSINDPMNPRWQEAVALLAPGFVTAAIGLAGIQARFTRCSLAGLGGAAAMVGGALWTIGNVVHAFRPRGCIAEECALWTMRETGVLEGILMFLSLLL